MAFIRRDIPGQNGQESSWVLYNDEKVVKAEDINEMKEMKQYAYLYFFTRV